MTIILSAKEIAVAIGEYIIRHRCWPGDEDSAEVYFDILLGNPLTLTARCESGASNGRDIADDALESTGGMH